MATSSTTPFVFPNLRFKKSNVKLLNFDRLCFQFLVARNKECTLVGYKMLVDRTFKRTTELVEVEKDEGEKATKTHKPVLITGKVLFVQLELTAEEIRLAKAYDDDDLYIRMMPVKKEIRGYYYVVYKINAALSSDGLETAPCPPAIPPGG